MSIPKIESVCLVFFLALVGCDNQPSGPTPEELLLRKQMRDGQKAVKGMTNQQRIASVKALLEEENAVAAIEEIKPLLLSEPENFEVIMLAAKVRANAGDPMGAVETLRAVDVRDTKNYADALWTGVPWLIESTDFLTAVEDMKKLLQLRPDDPKVLQKIVMVLHYLGNRSEAAVYLNRLVRTGQIREHELMAMNNFSIPFVDSAYPRPELENAINLALLSDAQMSFAENRKSKAASMVRQLRVGFPDSTSVAAFLGRIYATEKDFPRLHDWFASVPSGIEAEPEYWHALSSLCINKNANKNAVRCLLETVNRDPTNIVAYKQLAELLESFDENDTAKRVTAHADLIVTTNEITQILGERVGTNEELKRMADILDKLNRPLEALAWRKVTAGLISGNESRIAQLESQRKNLLEKLSENPLPSTAESLGLDLEAWPLPDTESLKEPAL